MVVNTDTQYCIPNHTNMYLSHTQTQTHTRTYTHTNTLTGQDKDKTKGSINVSVLGGFAASIC